MIDHLSVGVSDIDLARKFYDTLLDSLGITLLAATDQLLAYGSGTKGAPQYGGNHASLHSRVGGSRLSQGG